MSSFNNKHEKFLNIKNVIGKFGKNGKNIKIIGKAKIIAKLKFIANVLLCGYEFNPFYRF